MLNLIGIGLSDEKDITLKGLELVKKSDFVYLENYTSKLNCNVNKLEKLYGKKIILANREAVEGDDNEIIKNAKSKKVSLLIIGDPMSATTHTDLMLRANENKIKVEIIHNASIFTAVGVIGLQLYKFGKTTSIPFPQPNFMPKTPYEDLKKMAGVLGVSVGTLMPETEADAIQRPPAVDGVVLSKECLERFPGLETYIEMFNNAAKLGDEELIVYISEKIAALLTTERATQAVNQ